MTYLEIHKSIAEITRKKCNECKARLDNVPKENVTETIKQASENKSAEIVVQVAEADTKCRLYRRGR